LTNFIRSKAGDEKELNRIGKALVNVLKSASMSSSSTSGEHVTAAVMRTIEIALATDLFYQITDTNWYESNKALY